ncbi:MAG: acyl carrier protein [Burkholderiales bacterium]
MSDVRERLTGCFVAVFPSLSAEQAATASNETLDTWDSLATVTLVNVIEEEFHLQIDPEDFSEILSFAGAEALVQKALQQAT